MRNLVKSNRLLPLLFAATVTLFAGYALAGPAPTNKAANGPELKVVELGNGYQQNTGELQFENNKLVFTSTEGKTDSLSLDYGNLKKVEFKHARLLKIETENGQHEEFTPFGAAKFDPTTVAYLKNHVGSSVEFKSHIK
jgi:hypothetical protein